MSNDQDRVLGILRTVVEWAKEKREIRGVVLVGSYASNQARPDSDIDLVLLTEHPDDFRNTVSLSIDWQQAAVNLTKWADEQYGVVWCRRIWFNPNFELELGFAPLSWADVPVDKGTERVVSNGCRVLYDPDGRLKRLTLAVTLL